MSDTKKVTIVDESGNKSEISVEELKKLQEEVVVSKKYRIVLKEDGTYLKQLKIFG